MVFVHTPLHHARFLKLCDSQEFRWLPQDDRAGRKNDLKPDGFVIDEALVKDNGCRPFLFRCLRSLVEAKLEKAWTADTIAQAMWYAEKLSHHVPSLHVSIYFVGTSLYFP